MTFTANQWASLTAMHADGPHRVVVGDIRKQPMVVMGAFRVNVACPDCGANPVYFTEDGSARCFRCGDAWYIGT